LAAVQTAITAKTISTQPSQPPVQKNDPQSIVKEQQNLNVGKEQQKY